jgi:formylglycine-generating enzyme
MMYCLDVSVLGDGSGSAIRGVRALALALGCASASCNAFLGLSELSFEDDDDGISFGGTGALSGNGSGGVGRGGKGGSSGTAGSTGATVGSGGSNPGGGTSGTGSWPSTCRGHAGPIPVNIEGRFCIDSTEVTNADYAEFLASPPPPPTHPQCSWNFDYTPGGGWPAAVEDRLLPVGYVDYCDARGYCEWAGKRLCGAIGGAPFAHDSWPTNRLNTELYYACSGGGAFVYPYGNNYVATACVTDGQFRARAVGSSRACEGGFAGLFDLSGNAAEWQNSCTDLGFGNGENDSCRLGSYGSSWFDTGNPPGSDFSCGESVSRGRSLDFDDHGIRCCSDAIP